MANEWALQIQDVGRQDAGEYECQISTRPPKSRTVKLVVEEGGFMYFLKVLFSNVKQYWLE